VCRWRMLLLLSHCHVVLSRKEVPQRYKGGGQEVLSVVPPAVGMGILSINVWNGEGAGIIWKEDAQIVTVQQQGETVGGVY
jgi:hypothetical protein